MKIGWFLLIISLTLGCSDDQKHSEVILNRLKSFDTTQNYKFIRSYDEYLLEDSFLTRAYIKYYRDGSVWKISTDLDRKEHGHYFEFNHTTKSHTSKQLLKYRYMVGHDGLHYSYGINYSNESRNYEETGTPFVTSMENTNSDSFYKTYSLQFSYFPRENLQVYLSKDSVKFQSVQLYNSIFMPLLGEYDYEAKEDEQFIFIKIIASDLVVELSGLPDKRTTVKKVFIGNR